jgi:hypothetical protein
MAHIANKGERTKIKHTGRTRKRKENEVHRIGERTEDQAHGIEDRKENKAHRMTERTEDKAHGI